MSDDPGVRVACVVRDRRAPCREFHDFPTQKRDSGAELRGIDPPHRVGLRGRRAHRRSRRRRRRSTRDATCRRCRGISRAPRVVSVAIVVGGGVERATARVVPASWCGITRSTRTRRSTRSSRRTRTRRTTSSSCARYESVRSRVYGREESATQRNHRGRGVKGWVLRRLRREQDDNPEIHPEQETRSMRPPFLPPCRAAPAAQRGHRPPVPRSLCCSRDRDVSGDGGRSVDV